ncbi:caspase family protein, partial [Kitasatospora sp. NPDC093558]|uniref:caspase family protein n=1 Tax=Kitasatospora sp. NPDC093558 TaxID=3155201 RepID=UPI0034164EC3
MTRRALIIVNQHYEDPGFDELPGATADAEQLGAVLADPAVGGYEVEVVSEGTALTWRKAIQRFFTSADPQDTLVLHLSCHGRKDGRNRLHFAASDTSIELLEATAVGAEFLADQMRHSRCRHIVTFLDCCYSGAFTRGVRTRAADREVDVRAQLRGRAQVVITSATALQYSHENEARSRAGAEPSVFTAAVVEGLRDGAADLDQDGEVSADELYVFVHDRVRAQLPDQTPTWSADGAEGRLVVARNPSYGRPPGYQVVHVAEDRAWGEWIAAVLAGAGLRVTRRELTPQGPSGSDAPTGAAEPG